MDSALPAASDLCGAALIGEVVHRFGVVRLRAAGSSMLPSIWPGDVLTVCRAEIGALQAGDVALFTREGRLFAHRVVGHIVSDGRVHLSTRGDTVPASDGPVSASELLGVVVAVSRNGKGSRTFASRGGSVRLVSAFARRSARFSRIVQRVHRLAWSFPGVKPS